MMRRWIGPVGLALLLFATSGTTPLAAQGGDSCPTQVEAALTAVGEACADLDRNSACYGHAQVSATFSEPRTDLIFATPADRVPLETLSSLHTAAWDPLSADWGVALLHTQANLPDTLPGQAVTLLLMGDATLEDDSAPDDTGLAPLQAVYFSTGLSAPECQAAPNALIIHTPEGETATLRINDLDVQLGSTAVFTLAEVPASAQPVLVIALLQGHLSTAAGVAPVTLTQPFAAEPEALPILAITLNAEGRVDTASRLVAVPGEALAPTIRAACANAALAGVSGLDGAACGAPLAPYGPLTGDTAPEATPETPVEGGTENRTPTSYIFDVGTCESGRRAPVDDFQPGDVVTIYQGCRWLTRAEAEAAAAASSGFISVDGAPQAVQFGWVRWLEAEPENNLPAGWEASVRATWIATPGEHVAQGMIADCGPHVCAYRVPEE